MIDCGNSGEYFFPKNKLINCRGVGGLYKSEILAEVVHEFFNSKVASVLGELGFRAQLNKLDRK